ncbi:MAG: hypothetical protein Q7S69_08200 [Nitrosomonadaceae bacterium]|nr:hypothetical protein [Nitrosomonadaceae bacterium]
MRKPWVADGRRDEERDWAVRGSWVAGRLADSDKSGHWIEILSMP